MYYFLKEDYDRLVEQISELREKFKKLSKSTGDAKSGDQSESFGLEGIETDQTVLSTRVRELNAIFDRARVVEKPESNERVAIGKRVVVFCEDTETITTITIGSYRTFDKKGVFSYDAPLPKIIMGAKIGERREGRIANETRSYEIVSIE